MFLLLGPLWIIRLLVIVNIILHHWPCGLMDRASVSDLEIAGSSPARVDIFYNKRTRHPLRKAFLVPIAHKSNFHLKLSKTSAVFDGHFSCGKVVFYQIISWTDYTTMEMLQYFLQMEFLFLHSACFHFHQSAFVHIFVETFVNKTRGKLCRSL